MPRLHGFLQSAVEKVVVDVEKQPNGKRSRYLLRGGEIHLSGSLFGIVQDPGCPSQSRSRDFRSNRRQYPQGARNRTGSRADTADYLEDISYELVPETHFGRLTDDDHQPMLRVFPQRPYAKRWRRGRTRPTARRSITSCRWRARIWLIDAEPDEHPAALAVVLCRLAALDDLDVRPRLYFPCDDEACYGESCQHACHDGSHRLALALAPPTEGRSFWSRTSGLIPR